MNIHTEEPVWRYRELFLLYKNYSAIVYILCSFYQVTKRTFKYSPRTSIRERLQNLFAKDSSNGELIKLK